MLDNAADEAQVRPLLPNGSGCLVLVTSRKVLAGLEASHRLLLDVLAPVEAVALLGEIAGARVTAEPEAAAEVAALCGHLPLAVRIAGNRLASRPAWTVAFLAERLRDEHARLRLLQAGDLQVRAAFALSYAQASPAARALFQRLSLVPGPDFGPGVAAVLGELGEDAAEELLEELAEASLLLPAPDPGRYRFHDLMRLFAAERFHDEESEPARQAAEDRMLAWLLDTAIHAGETYFPAGEEHTTQPAAPVATRAAAKAWLEAERATIVAAAARCLELGRNEVVCRTTVALAWYHDSVGHVDDARTICELGCWQPSGPATSVNRPGSSTASGTGCGGRAATPRRRTARTGRWLTPGSATTCAGRRRHAGVLAGVAREQDRFEDAMDHLREALAAYEATGDRHETAYTLSSMGLCLQRAGRFEEAVSLHRRALATRPEVDDGTQRWSLGQALAATGRHDEAIEALQQAAEANRAAGNTWFEGAALRDLGVLLGTLGRAREAADHLTRAVARFESGNDQEEEAGALRELGATMRKLGDTGQAGECWRRALEIYERLDLPEAEQVRDSLRRLDPET